MAAERERRLARSAALATASPRGVGRRSSSAASQENPYLGLLLRWWWVIALCTLLGLLVGLLYNRFGPVPYQSTALVAVNSDNTLLNTRQTTPGRQQGIAAETFAAQMASPPVAELVSKELAGRYDLSPGDLLSGLQNKKIDIRAIKNSNLISVTATDPDPQLAFALADAYAGAFVGAVNQAAGQAVASRRQELESQIEYSRQQLTTTQLKQREQDLNTQLQTARGQLLQLQLQYQTELQRQIEAERAQSLAEQRTRGGPQALSPEALDRINAVEASQDRARSGALGAISAQVSDAQGQIGDLSAQLAEVRAALSQGQSQGEGAEGAPPPSALDVAGQVATKTTELQQLQRELEYDRQVAQQRQQIQNSQNQILNQIQGQRNRLLQLQFQNERAVAAAADAEARADDDDNNNNAKRTAQTAAANRDRTLEFNALQQREIEGTINSLNSQLNAVKQREAQLPPEVTPAQTAAKQQGIISLEQEITQLKSRQTQVDRQEVTSKTQLQELQRREQTLTQQLEGARGRLRQAQAAYQQETQRQAEAERRQTIEAEQRAAQTEAAQAALSPSLSPEQQAQIEQASNSAAQVRSDWLQLINEQQKGVQARIDELNGELQQVRDALAQLPPSSDRAGMTSFATAYAGVLGQLTQDFVELQINTGVATSPVDRFGEASEPTLVNSLRRMIPIGAGAGMGLGCAIAYLLEMRRQRRLAYLPNTQTTTLAVPATLGVTNPVYNGAQRAAYRRSMQPTARIRRRRPASV